MVATPPEATTEDTSSTSEKSDVYTEKNKWGTSFFIQGDNELQQARTNSYILILTMLTFLQGAFGINKIMLASLEIIQNFLLYMANMIGKIL